MDDRSTDGELLAAFEAGGLTAADFPHARHVRVAWMLARAYGPQEGLRRLVEGIRGIVARAGLPQAFHVTITRAWFELISSVEDLEAHEELFDKRLLAPTTRPRGSRRGARRGSSPTCARCGCPER